MDKLDLKGEKREKSTKGYINTLRKSGKIPAICYGKSDNVLVSVVTKEFEKIFLKSGSHIIIDLEIASDTKRRVLVRDYQISPIQKEITHIDFYEVNEDKPVIAKVPIKLNGLSDGVRKGGILEHTMHTLTIECLPKDIPHHIDVDVSELNVGDTVRVDTIDIAKEIKLLSRPNQAVASVTESRTTKMDSMDLAAAAAAAGETPDAAADADADAEKKESD